MKFKAKIQQGFLAKINSIEFNHENIYYTIGFLLSELEEKFENINIKDEFIDDLKWAVTHCYNDSPDNASLDEIEHELEEIINKTDAFDKLKFMVNESDYYFKDVNDKIKSYII